MVRVCYCICLCISPQIFTINPKQEDHQREGKRKSLPREMGRGKIEIKRIENSSNRQVTYSKRKNGILKKAKEITVLCDAQVSLIIFAASGKMHEYISPSTTLIDILERYHKTSGKRLWDAKHEDLNNEIDRLKKENDSMQIELRHLKGEDVNQLNYKELMALEDALECGLDGVRERQNCCFYADGDLQGTQEKWQDPGGREQGAQFYTATFGYGRSERIGEWI
ncbi:agamous-like MADS-box protein MADS9 isoform X4 [Prosopis cineraria]|uniref:agamous-like MADS-box protein MADS9 isoform X4 n=1 Tax=Prosopis cineraria TaxID=364024 RepID=UPI0024100216|nr:agamous-like MADS-box protein MADS9 isoform X4 [Prosopis cineraria]